MFDSVYRGIMIFKRLIAQVTTQQSASDALKSIELQKEAKLTVKFGKKKRKKKDKSKSKVSSIKTNDGEDVDDVKEYE